MINKKFDEIETKISQCDLYKLGYTRITMEIPIIYNK